MRLPPWAPQLFTPASCRLLSAPCLWVWGGAVRSIAGISWAVRISPNAVKPAFLRKVFLLALSLLAIASSVSARIIHRWSFSETSGVLLADSVGNLDGQIVTLGGAGHSLNDGQVTLQGGPHDTSDYVQIPVSPYGNLLGGLTDFTLEIWATPHSFQTWERLFSIGSGTGSDDSLWWSITRGNTGIGNQQQFRFQPLAGVNGSLGTQENQQYHYVVTWDADGNPGGNGRLEWYRDGARVGVIDTGAYSIADVNDNVLWLGRSEYRYDSTANASWNEVRIYDEVLTPEMIAATRAGGPDDASGTAPVAVPDAVTVGIGGQALVHVLANDSGITLSPTSVEVVSPPASGTAIPDGTGRIRYLHSGSNPGADSFTYRVRNIFGTPSNTVTVNLTITGELRIENPNIFLPEEAPALGLGGVNAFEGLSFRNPICLRTPPGEIRQLFVAEKAGRIFLIPDVTAPVPVKILFLDLAAVVDARPNEQFNPVGSGGLLSFAFHPDFATNGEFFVYYTLDIDAGGGFQFHDRLSRFRVQAGNPEAADPTSEQPFFTQFDESIPHNGGGMHFGPSDGYLYLSLGDEGGGYDYYDNSQKIDKDFFSAMLRIDVDLEAEDHTAADGTGSDDANLPPTAHPAIDLDADGNPFYEIPADNPFIGASTFNGLPLDPAAVRTEFWAVGLRNPWQWWFDPYTHQIILGDVGQGKREEINIIEAGKNYGWKYFEGLREVSPQPPGFVHELPIYEYSHGSGEFRGDSVTGGVVYYGTNPNLDIPELNGLYIFADYATGNVWSLDPDDPYNTVQRIFGESGIITFGYDPSNGDVLYGSNKHGMIKRIARTTEREFPQTLTETGLFSNLATLEPNPAVLAYDPNVPFWSDYAIKRRWFAIPSSSDTITYSKDGNWTFPSGSIWIKHLDLEMERGVPSSARRIETRINVKNDSGTYGVSYRWNDSGTEAYLVEDAGANLFFQIDTDPGPGQSLIDQPYRIPSRAECLACHTPAGGYALSFNTRQLNKTSNLGGLMQNQLQTLSEAGYFDRPVTGINTLPRLVRADEEDYSLEHRVRSYLAVNCGQCHQPGTGAPETWDARAHLTTEATGIINGIPVDDGGDPANKLIVPGSESHSVILQRLMGSNGFARMPTLGSHLLDDGGIQLLKDWINLELPGRQSYRQWRIAHFGNDDSPEGAKAFDADGDRKSNYEEFLTGNDPHDYRDYWKPSTEIAPGTISFTYERPPNRSFQVEVSTDLINWELWDAPGNAPFFGAAPALPTLSIPFTPQSDHNYYFRWLIKER